MFAYIPMGVMSLFECFRHHSEFFMVLIYLWLDRLDRLGLYLGGGLRFVVYIGRS
jgi:hypothetical protein